METMTTDTSYDLSRATQSSTGHLSTRMRFTAALSEDMARGCALPRVYNTMEELKSALTALPHFVSNETRQECPSPSRACGEKDDEKARSFGWVHCMGLTHEETSTLLSWLPLNMSTYQSVLSAPTDDALEYFPNDGCVFLAIAAVPSHRTATQLHDMRSGDVTAGHGDNNDDSAMLGKDAGAQSVDLSDRVHVYVLAFEGAIVSFAQDHFAGEDELFALVMRLVSAADALDSPFAKPVHVRTNDMSLTSQNDDTSAKLVSASTYSNAHLSSPTSKLVCGEYERSRVAYMFSLIVCAIINTTCCQVPILLVRSEHMDDLILEVVPSVFDEPDMFQRIKEIRKIVAKFHVELLLKERLLKHLLLPALRHTAVCRDNAAVENYRGAATTSRNAIKKLRRCRDLMNMSNMNLINGVASRLLRQSNVMDYLNNIQTRIALVVAPVSIIPAMWAVNIMVPFSDLVSLKPFIIVTTITMAALFFGLSYSVVGYFTYRAPGPLVTLFKEKKAN